MYLIASALNFCEFQLWRSFENILVNECNCHLFPINSGRRQSTFSKRDNAPSNSSLPALCTKNFNMSSNSIIGTILLEVSLVN